MSLTIAVEHGDARHKALCALFRQDGHSAVLTGKLDEPEVLASLPPGAAIAVAPKLSAHARSALKARGTLCAEYQAREECVLAHAVITAENAIQLALQSSAKTLAQTSTLVVGFGRIGKEICRMLRGLGANPAASARSPRDLCLVKAHGFTALDTSALEKCIGDYELIFNTVPALILTENILAHARPDSMIFDLASKPGGVDFEAAQRLGLSAVHALALPGKLAPLSSAAAIRDAVYNILSEEGIF